MKKINIKRLLICLAIPLTVGMLTALATKDDMNVYKEIVKPFFAPAPWVFMTVWPILYLLMGVSLYMVSVSPSINKSKAYYIFAIQLALNSMWSFVFFSFRMFLASFLVLLVLIFMIGEMIKSFNEINEPAAKLQVPYFVWVMFAGVLNFFIFIMN